MHTPRWGQVARSPSGLHPATTIGVQVCHAGVPHLVDRPTQLICISDLYMSTDKYKRHSRFATQVNLTSVLPRPQALLSLTTTSVTSLNIRPRGSLKDLSIDRIFDFLYWPIFLYWPKLPKLKSHLRCSSKLKVQCPFLLPLQASTTALQIAFEQYFSLQNVFGFYENLY